MRHVLFGLALAACGGAAPSPSPPPAAGPLPISCHGGRELVYERPLPNGDRRIVTLRCTDDGANASVTITTRVPPDSDMSPVVSESGPVAVDHETFARVWRAAVSGRCDRNKPTRTSLTVTDVSRHRSVTCADDDAWAALLAPIESTLPAPSEQPIEWPFRGEYWKDELRYYARNRFRAGSL